MDQAVHPVSSGARLSLAVLAAFAGIYVIWGTTYLAISFAIHAMPPFISGVARFSARRRCDVRMAARTQSASVRWRQRADDGALPAYCCRASATVSWSGRSRAFRRGIAALFVAAVPVLVLIFDWAFFSKRAPTKQALFGIAVAIAGVVTIVMHTRTLSGNAHPLYILAMFVATIGWSFGHAAAEALGEYQHGAQLHVRADAVRWQRSSC